MQLVSADRLSRCEGSIDMFESNSRGYRRGRDSGMATRTPLSDYKRKRLCGGFVRPIRFQYTSFMIFLFTKQTDRCQTPSKSRDEVKKLHRIFHVENISSWFHWRETSNCQLKPNES